MDDLFDVLVELLGWVLPLLGKFWVLILGYLGYLLFGKQARRGRKMTQGKQQLPPLTPVDGGGTVRPMETRPERRMVVRQEPQPAPMEERTAEPEWLEEERRVPLAKAEAAPAAQAAQAVGPSAAGHPSRGEGAPETPTALDPREGMKWAIIFGPPRAKSRPLPFRRSV
ncbi:hypothetical protein O3V59_09850 [Brevibacillus thermoruber]|uniref:Uncharacterized protein n=1 Tax=Brevibacillus thermoruber TaxID=33942 RepID=A0A9X3Z3J4_9BACL|nr:hypothetical protein [Brevibacillus thermoruber]MDA5108665.1 hypothetical protein [Brevibacillus thermoruber]